MTPISRIIDMVAETYGVTRDELMRKGQSKTIREARVVAMFLCRTQIIPTPSFPEIGKAFGRDHTTIMTSVKSAMLRQIRDPYMMARVTAIACELGMPRSPEDVSRLPLSSCPIELDPDRESLAS